MKKGFTLAEVLITLAIIGVVAAMTIPSVIVRTNQQEFKTGVKKALSALNSAIMLSSVQDGVSPFDTGSSEELATLLAGRMNVIKTGNASYTPDEAAMTGAAYANTGGSASLDTLVFYTADGFRYEVPSGQGHCGSYGVGINKRYEVSLMQPVFADRLSNDPKDYDPCYILVDVNGDKGPTTSNDTVSLIKALNSDKITDLFVLYITDTGAVAPEDSPAFEAMTESIVRRK